MRTTVIATLVLSFFALTKLQAQEPIVEKGFLIVHSTKDYPSALKTAREASQKLDLELDLRGYYANEETGLETDAICGCGEAHGYIARGRFDDGAYISIEYSDRFDGFAQGYYIVVAASDTKNAEELTKTLNKTKVHFAEAYVKNTSVYVGCMH